MKKPLLILLLLSMNGYSDVTEKKLTSYTCKNESDAYSCSNTCKKEEMQYSFLVEKGNRQILQKYYIEGKLVGSTIVDECNIFDNKNWECTYQSDYFQGRSWKGSRKMNNGIYTAMTVNSYLADDKNKKRVSDSFSCAK